MRRPSPIRVLIVDGQRLMCEALSHLLRRHGFTSLATATDAATAIDRVATFKPGVVLMDVCLPGLDGIEAARRISARAPGTALVMLSERHAPRWVRGAIDAGAKGFLSKRASGEEIADAIRAAAANEHRFSLDVVPDLVRAIERTPIEDPRALSSREREVLGLVARGRSTSEIARQLGVRPKTVANCRDSVMRKIDVRGVAGLTRYAVRKGIVEA